MAAMWYSASLLFKTVHNVDPAPISLWEDVIVLIEAPDEIAARSVAARIGKDREHEYFVTDPIRHKVRWTYVTTERLCEIDADVLKSETELFSRFISDDEATSLMKPLSD